MKYKLSDICEYVRGKVAVSTLNNSTYISTENMLPSKGGIVEAATLPPVESTQVYLKGDVLVSNIRPYFEKIWMANTDGGCSNDVLVFRAKPEINPIYLYYVLSDKQFFNYATATSKGTKMPRGDRLAIMEYEVRRHTRKEQDGIASVLYSIDKKIELNNNINNNLYELLQLSFENDYLEKCQLNSNWETVTLDFATSRFGTGLNPRKNFVLGHGSNYYVTIKNMGNNRVYLDERCDKVDDEAIRKIQNRSDLQVGDLLFSGIGTIGRVYLIDKPVSNWNTSESVFNLRPNYQIVSSEFLFLLLLNRDMQEYAVNLASGSVQKGIRMADLKRYKFILPSKDTIDALTQLWKPIISKIKSNEDENDRLSALRDTLLPKLMSGEIDVSELDI